MMSGQERVRFVEPAHTVRGELDFIALEAQRALQDLGDLLVVFDDEHTHGTAGGIHPKDGTPPSRGNGPTF